MKRILYLLESVGHVESSILSFARLSFSLGVTVLPFVLILSIYLLLFIYLFFDSAGTYVVSELSVVSLSGDVTASVSSPKTAGCDVTASLTVNVSTVRSDSERTEKNNIKLRKEQVQLR